MNKYDVERFYADRIRTEGMMSSLRATSESLYAADPNGELNHVVEAIKDASNYIEKKHREEFCEVHRYVNDYEGGVVVVPATGLDGNRVCTNFLVSFSCSAIDALRHNKLTDSKIADAIEQTVRNLVENADKIKITDDGKVVIIAEENN